MASKLKSIVEGGSSYDIEFSNELLNQGSINEKSFNWDVLKLNDGHFSIIKDNKSHQLEILKIDHASKYFFLKVDGVKVKLKIEDRFDVLLHKLGLEDLGSGKISNVLAPMPGLVLKIQKEVGESVEMGEAIIVLEAMKMENVLKSPTQGKIKNIAVKTGDAVEKNQLLIEFE